MWRGLFTAGGAWDDQQGRDRRMASDIKYARSGDVHIAYRVFGTGPRDLVLIPGTLSHAGSWIAGSKAGITQWVRRRK